MQAAHGPHVLHDLEQVVVIRHRASSVTVVRTAESYPEPEACAHRRNDARSARPPPFTIRGGDSMRTVGSGTYQYELNESWAKLPTGSARELASDIPSVS